MPGGKIWTKRDILTLYNLSEQVSQRAAARRLGRTEQAVETKAARLGIVWRQGWVTYADIAREVGCCGTTVKRMADILLHGEVRRHGKANSSGSRVMLDHDEAKRITAVLQRTLEQRPNHVRAGILSGVKRRQRRDARMKSKGYTFTGAGGGRVEFADRNIKITRVLRSALESWGFCEAEPGIWQDFIGPLKGETDLGQVVLRMSEIVQLSLSSQPHRARSVARCTVGEAGRCNPVVWHSAIINVHAMSGTGRARDPIAAIRKAFVWWNRRGRHRGHTAFTTHLDQMLGKR